jgi:CubicO group peptidase (beta-lactamase class C family)
MILRLAILLVAGTVAASASKSLHGQGVASSNSSIAPDFSTVREYIKSRIAAASTPSMAVAVARGNEILWEEGFGWIDRQGGTPATPDTLYYAASVTKAVTATALMVLYERRQFDLDRPANRYLKRAKLRSPQWNPDDATVRRIATHTAGFTTYDSRDPLPATEIMRRYGVIFWRPGERFDYSNFGFGVLGQIIQDVSGRSFQSFVHDEVLRPLGMHNAWAGAAPTSTLPVAPRYSARTRAFSPPLTEPTMPGASVLFTSAHELALFGMFHNQALHAAQKPILSEAAITALQEPSVPAGGGRQSLAWSIDENRYGYRTLLAQGGTFDSQAWLMLVPTEKITVALLSNTGSAPAIQTIDQILSNLLPAYAENLAKATQLQADTAGQTPVVAAPPLLVGMWRGEIHTYRGKIPLALTMRPGGEMEASSGSAQAALLTASRFADNRAIGRMRVDLGIDYPAGTPYEVRLELEPHGDKLTGAAVTYAPEGYEGPRLPFWVELKRAARK